MRSEELISASIDSMNGHDFERWCAWLLSESGFTKVTVTKGSGDQGVDIIAEKDGTKYAIQCKRYKKPLGNKPIQEVYTGMQVYHCDKGLVMTNTYFTSGAMKAASATGVDLWDRAVISQMLYTTRKEKEKEEKQRIERSSARWVKEKSQPKPLRLIIVIICLTLVYYCCIIHVPFIINNIENTTTVSKRITASTDKEETIEETNDIGFSTTFDMIELAMTREEVHSIFENNNEKYISSNKENTVESYTRNIVSPRTYPEIDLGMGICINDYVFPDDYKYMNQKVDSIRLYYLYDFENDTIDYDDSHSILYAIKYVFVTESPEPIFRSIAMGITAKYGMCYWEGYDLSQIYGNQETSMDSTELEYRLWKLEGNTQIALSGKNDEGIPNTRVQDVEVSFFNSEADRIIDQVSSVMQSESIS